MLTRLQQFLTTPSDKISRSTTIFWFCLSLTCAAAIALAVLRKALTDPFILQDDVRQHVFWMWRFADPGLFPNDLIADYFQSVAPWGYTTVYRGLAAIGIDPLFASKLIPIPLAILTAAYCFAVTLQILPVPFAGFLAAVLLNQNLMRSDDLYSATPRAFLYPLFLAVLYYWLRRSRLSFALAMALLGLFYPQTLFVACVVLLLSLVRWQGGRPRWSPDRQDFWFCAIGLGSAAIVLLAYVLQQGSAQFGPSLWAAEARGLPEFWGSGRLSFFNSNWFEFWIINQRSGILPRPERLFVPPLLTVGLFLPTIFWRSRWLPLTQRITHEVRVLGWTIAASVLLYGAAHLLLFKLHLPSRYTQHSFRMVLAIAAGVVLTVVLDAVLRWVSPPDRRIFKRVMVTVAIGGLTIMLLSFPLLAARAPGFVAGRATKLYEFLAEQPKDSLIASISRQADFVPMFARRSVLASQEAGIVYHKRYYEQYRQRMIDQIQAQYSPNLEDIRRFQTKYNITHWLLDRNAFRKDYFDDKAWMRQQYPDTVNAAIATLDQNVTSALKQARARCTVFKRDRVLVLDARCVVEPLNQP
jgi:hypothetical protein